MSELLTLWLGGLIGGLVGYAIGRDRVRAKLQAAGLPAYPPRRIPARPPLKAPLPPWVSQHAEGCPRRPKRRLRVCGGCGQSLPHSPPTSSSCYGSLTK